MQLLGAFYGVPQSIFLFLFFWGQIIATEAARRSRGGEAFSPIEWQSNAAKNSNSIRRTLQVLWPGFLYVGIFSDFSSPLNLPSALAEHDVEILIATFLRRSQRAVQQIEALPETPSLPTPCLPLPATLPHRVLAFASRLWLPLLLALMLFGRHLIYGKCSR